MVIHILDEYDQTRLLEWIGSGVDECWTEKTKLTNIEMPRCLFQFDYIFIFITQMFQHYAHELCQIIFLY